MQITSLLFAVFSIISAITLANPIEKLSPFSLDPGIFESETLSFIPHAGAPPFGSYLSMALPFEPAKALYAALKEKTGKSLSTRGEAHITVVTPVEYANTLKKYLSIEQINAIAEKDGIQAAPFHVECLGYGSAVVDKQFREAYFIVVKSKALLQIRRHIHTAFVKAGGAPSAFNPGLFYPHITVGYTNSDVHYENGVIKDHRSCVADLEIR